MSKLSHDRKDLRTAALMDRARRSTLPLAFCLLSSLVLLGCRLDGDQVMVKGVESSLDADTSLETTPSEPPVAAATITAIPLPEQINLGLEARWAPQVSSALDDLPLDLFPVPIVIHTLEPSLEHLRSSKLDLVMISDSHGEIVAQRALALGVPWTSEWEGTSLEQAQAMLEDGNPFIAPIEWAAMQPTMKPLKIDGLHPTNANYPFSIEWSLHARPGFESLATSLADVLRPYLADDVIKVTAVGDIMLARGLGERIASGEDPHPFAAVGHLLSDAEITIGNLESALASGGSPENKGYTFLAPPIAAQTLSRAGFDLLSLANNHAMDYGPASLLEGIELLQQKGIDTVGGGKDLSEALSPATIDVPWGRIAVLAFVDVPVEFRGFDTRAWSARENRAGVAWADPVLMQSAIEAAQSTYDCVIVLLHSGYEYVESPSPPQQTAAHLAIEAGANLVLGHHAHVVQGVEFLEDGIIVYGLGNFAFEDGGVYSSALANIWIDQDGVRSLEFLPLYVAPDGRPAPADPARAEEILQTVYSLTTGVLP